MNPTITRVSFVFPRDLIARLKSEQQKTGAPVSEIVRRAVAAYLDRANQ